MSIEGERVLAEKIDWQNRQIEKLHHKIIKLKSKLKDARNYAAEIAQGITHYPHVYEESCVRCERESFKQKFAGAVEDAANYERPSRPSRKMRRVSWNSE